MSNWNDDRLDKRDQEVKEGFTEVRSEVNALRSETNKGFAELRSEMHKGFAELRSEMNKGFAEVHSAYATLNRTLLVGAGGIIAALIGVAGALVVALAA